MAPKTFRKKGAFKNAKRVYKSKKLNLVQTIKRVISKSAEVKMQSYTGQLQVQTYGANPLMDTIPLSPTTAINGVNIIQGTGQGDRIGDRISTKKCVMRMTAFPYPYSTVSNLSPKPQDVILWFGRLKYTTLPPTSTDFGKFFQNGDNAIAPSSTLTDILQPINKDLFTVVKCIRFKLGFASYNGSGTSVNQQGFSNNDYKFNFIRNINLTKLMAKQYRFNDSGSVPTNSALYMWCESLPADGSLPAATTLPMQLDYVLDYNFTDL